MIGDLLILLRATADEWLRLRWADLQFAEARTALLLFVALLGTAVIVLLGRGIRSARPGRTHVALPAIVPMMRRPQLSAVRHVPLLLFLLGLPFFAIALADPHTGFSQEEVTHPGRRIELLVDASTSMVMEFKSERLNAQGSSTFFTAVAAAERFMKRRMNGPYHDLIALIQFGNEAYVVTPFTTDYDNVLLSIRLISDPKEWGRFSDFGTTIVEGLDKGIELFRSFDFVRASGNLMIVFTDGRDSELNRQGKPLDRLVAQARAYRIPIYMIRTAYGQANGRVQQDAIWQPIIERTGGRFYAASDEEAIVNALADIDKLSPGKIDVRQYSVSKPRYAGFTLIACGCWLAAVLLKLTVRSFRTFP
jgi:Ca-activated chloride channel family protein